jgi:hypothetical protein
MYGTQTLQQSKIYNRLFENDVKMYGTQTKSAPSADKLAFENDVKMYGTQTLWQEQHENIFV